MSAKPVVGVLTALLTALFWFLVKETYVAIAIEEAVERFAHWLGLPRAPMMDALAPAVVALGAASVVAWASYGLGVRDRSLQPSPLPDIDPRKAFTKIMENKRWLKKNTVTDPKRLAQLVSNYLDICLAREIHAALAQEKLWTWGHVNLQKGEGPFDRIPATKWQEMEIIFDADLERRAVARWINNKDGLAYLGIKLSATQVAKQFSIKERALR